MPKLESPSPADQFIKVIALTYRRLYQTEKCSPRVTGTYELRQALQELNNEVSGAFASAAFTRLALPRYLHDVEKDFQVTADYRSEKLRLLLGTPLYDEYLAAVKHFHWKSPDFDFVASGVCPALGLKGFQKYLRTFPSSKR